MGRKIALIVSVVVLIAIAVGAGIVQAKEGQPHLAPGVWYSTTIHIEHENTAWDGVTSKPDTFTDTSIVYQRVGDTLFWSDSREVQVFKLGEGDVWERRTATWEMVSPSGALLKHVFTQPQNITFDVDGITLTSSRDVYILLPAPSPPPNRFTWMGSTHRTSVGEAPLGKPTRP
jgi:hypothetical protein